MSELHDQLASLRSQPTEQSPADAVELGRPTSSDDAVAAGELAGRLEAAGLMEDAAKAREWEQVLLAGNSCLEQPIQPTQPPRAPPRAPPRVISRVAPRAPRLEQTAVPELSRRQGGAVGGGRKQGSAVDRLAEQVRTITCYI